MKCRCLHSLEGYMSCARSSLHALLAADAGLDAEPAAAAAVFAAEPVPAPAFAAALAAAIPSSCLMQCVCHWHGAAVQRSFG